MNSEAKKVYRTAITTYGLDAQRKMAVEEMAELTNALMKFERGRNTDKDVIDEIADVTIMMRQMALMFGEDAVQARVDFKIRRLAERLVLED